MTASNKQQNRNENENDINEITTVTTIWPGDKDENNEQDKTG